MSNTNDLYLLLLGNSYKCKNTKRTFLLLGFLFSFTKAFYTRVLPHPSGRSVAILCLKGHAEVSDFANKVLSHQDISCCQVTVHDLQMETT